jgi:hypothetical protein
MNMRWKNRITRMMVSSAMLAGIGALGGCVSYTNVPGPDNVVAYAGANNRQTVSVMSKALETMVAKHPVEGAFVVNLPMGTSPESYEKIIGQLPDGATIPSEGMDEDQPTFHIGRVWIRASDAKVDVIYPFLRADGVRQEQNVTLWLSGGVRKWRVYREQYWAPGTIPTPAIYVPIVPDEEVVEEVGDDTNEAQLDEEQSGEDE